MTEMSVHVVDRKRKGFGPKSADHPSIGKPCPACNKAFEEGDHTVLVPLGPGKDEESRQRRDEDRGYNAVALEIHWECAEKRYQDES